jgi:hypothetical protein
MLASPRILYLDQNAWISLARGAWDAAAHPAYHAALTRVVKALQDERIIVPLSFTNIYETFKINDPIRRAHLARVQSSISGGKVVRGRRRIFEETLLRHIAKRSEIEVPPAAEGWFLSDLWFEAAADYTPNKYGFEISERALDLMRQNPAYTLFNYLSEPNDAVRLESVRRHTAASAELIRKLEMRRQIVNGESFALRRRAYGARLLIDEIDFIITTAERLGLHWSSISDIGSSLLKSLVTDVPIMNVECELVIRLEDQKRTVNENDLRDMASFTAVLPLADMIVAEKAFVNLARQAGLDKKYCTALLTTVSDLTCD